MAIKISGTTVIPDTLGSANQVLRINSGGTEGEWGDASGGVTYLSKTANYTASANEGILSDTSGGTFTVTLPASPSEGDIVIINDAAGSWNTNNLTVERNGSTIDGDAENMTLDVDNASVEFIYDGATWGVYAGAGLVSSSATYDKTEFTATAGQTSFTVDYKVGLVDVYLNGVKLAASDYTATNETSVVLVEAAALNDILEVIAWNVFGIAQAYTDAKVDIHLNTSTATTDQVLSWTGSDYDWVTAGGGLFKGENGTVGDPTTGAGDIFRVNEQTLNTSTTIDADENASATGPLAIATGVTLTVTAGGNLSIV